MVRMLQRTHRYFVTGAHEEYLLSQWVMSIMIVVHWALGAPILIGGSTRFSLPTYQPVIDMVDGHVWIWGLILIISGTLMMAPFKWPNVAGIWIGMAWMITWTAL